MVQGSRDLTTGGIYKNLFTMAIPTALGFLGQTIYDVVDMIWLGRISSFAVAGVTVFATVFWSVEVLNEIIGMSSVSMISQSYGAKNYNRTDRVIEQAITFKALVALIAMIFLILFLKPLLNFLSQDSLVIRDALDYGYIRIFFLPIMFSSYTVNTALRCIGDAKSPMLIMLFASLLNVILDPLFIFDKFPGTQIPGLNLGVFGAALATVISTTAAFMLGFSLLFSGKRGIKPSLKGLLKLDWSIDAKLLTIGLPTGIEMLTRNLSWFISLKIIASFGTAAVAAIGIGNRFSGLLVMPLIGLHIGANSIVGQNLGANQVERARKTVLASVVVGSVFMIIMVTFSLLFPNLIMKIFIDDPQVIAIGSTMIRILSPSFIFLAVFFGLGSAFGGAGYMLPFTTSSVISRWGIQVPMLIVFITVMKLPIESIWVALATSEIVESIIMLLAYRQGKWKTKRV
jgi:putative MATE family efflux protein